MLWKTEHLQLPSVPLHMQKNGWVIYNDVGEFFITGRPSGYDNMYVTKDVERSTFFNSQFEAEGAISIFRRQATNLPTYAINLAYRTFRVMSPEEVDVLRIMDS